MEVITSARHLAMFQIVRNLIRERPVFELNEVCDQWQTTGLRHTDCPIAVAEMVRDHLMISYQSCSHQYLELTEAGISEYHNCDESLIRQVNDGLILLRAKAQGEWLAPSRRRRHRRREDQSREQAPIGRIH